MTVRSDPLKFWWLEVENRQASGPSVGEETSLD